MKRLPYVSLGLFLLATNLVLPVILQEFYIADLVEVSGQASIALNGLLQMPIALGVVYLVYKRSKDAGNVFSLFWIWLFASIVSVSSYYFSLYVAFSANSYIYYGADLICLVIGLYLVFAPSAPEKIPG